ncbi:MAG: hypothetical protein SNJ72_05970 [Fimbriimonadales bacterium]
MRALQELRQLLHTLAEQVEVLPAVGGAIEDLQRPDAEEREDQTLNFEERVFETIFERDPEAPTPRPYRPVPAIPRTQHHLFRYFLDGSFRSYFLGTALEEARETPVHYAQIGACTLRREADGSVRREDLRTYHLLLAGKSQLSEMAWARLEALAQHSSVKLMDLTERDVLSGSAPDLDLRNIAAGKVRYAMRRLEAEMMGDLLDHLNDACWLIADGSLMFSPIFNLLDERGTMMPVIGVSKNFRKDPQFVFGRGPRAERRSIYKLLADLEAAHRTAVFSAREGRVVFWYVRLREQRHLDYPLMGVVKVELVNPSAEPVDSQLIDRLSGALVAERQVTPHGQDRRWHAHLYPIFLAERAVKESLLSREVVQQSLKWR